jgi:ubiquinone/menaquinone biosynthesis C-methylase UbiE
MLLRLSGLLSCKARLVGVDINSSAISRATANAKHFQGKPKVEFRCANAENMTFKDGKFDVVAANLSFSAFRRPAKVASVTSQLLKRNGRLIASEVSSIRPLGKLGQLADAVSRKARYNLFSPIGLTNLFIPYGFERTRIVRVPLKAMLMKRYVRIPSGLSPVFLVELSKPISYMES